MQSSSYLKSITKDIFNPSSIIFYGLCGSLLILILSIGMPYDIFTKYSLSLIFSVYFSLKVLNPYFKKKRIKLILSLPLTRKFYYSEYAKPYIYLVFILLLSTCLFTFIIPENFFKLIESCGVLIISISLGFIKSIKPLNLSTLDDILLFIVLIFLVGVLLTILIFIKFKFSLLGSFYILLFSLLFVAYSIISTKKKFLKQCY
ncbi:MAG: hypothetical protein RR620_02315 [Clostridium sp.]